MNIIPAIQASLAAELVNLGVSQVQAAKYLSVAPSAISQYLSGKRGYRIVFDDDINEIIRDIAKEIQAGKLDEDALEHKFCELCGVLRGGNSCCLSCKE